MEGKPLLPARSMELAIVTPAPPGSQHGNRNTALRWCRHFEALGHRVRVDTRWDGAPADLLIALHARRSHDSLARWKAVHPERPAVLVLTGTDVYRDIHVDASAQRSLELADRLVVLQERALDDLSEAQRRKTVVIHQSVGSRLRRAPRRGPTVITVIGHLREEKDPFRAALALRHLDGDAIRIVHLGAAMSQPMAREARRRMRADARYRWLGELPHAHAMRWLAGCHAMVISSRMEGGAHVVSEAIAIGVPVLASRIPGNVGLLGTDYRGYYPAEDDRALAALISRTAEEPAFRARLARQVRARRPLVSVAREREALASLIESLR